MSDETKEEVIDVDVDVQTTDIIPPQPKRRSEMVQVTQDGVAFNSLADLTGFAGMVVRAKLAPYGMTQEGAAAAMVMGRGFGLNEMASMQQIVPVNGQLSWRGQAAVALIRNSGKCVAGTLKFWTEGEGDEMVGIAVAQRVGDKTAERRVFTIAHAKRAGLLPAKDGSGWQKYPERMLMWRAVGFIARDLFSDVLGGFPLAEEAVDFDDSAKRETHAPGVAISKRQELPPPAKPDPFMEAITGRDADTRRSPDASVDGTDAGESSAAADGDEAVVEQSATEDEDTCSHGLVLSVPCDECEQEDKAAALEAEKAEGEK